MVMLLQRLWSMAVKLALSWASPWQVDASSCLDASAWGLRQAGYSRRLSGVLFSGVRRRDLTKPGRNGYSGGRFEPILKGSFGNVGDGREEVGAARVIEDSRCPRYWVD